MGLLRRLIAVEMYIGLGRRCVLVVVFGIAVRQEDGFRLFRPLTWVEYAVLPQARYTTHTALLYTFIIAHVVD
jgi:hypothetical protein